mgnify:CR=1 FL=1
MLSIYFQTKAKSGFVSIRDDSTSIYYHQKGEGKKTLLFLHGWCINSSYWEDQLTFFSDQYSVYSIDLPGFGKSSSLRNQWTIEEYARDVVAFIEELNLKNVILIGHSMSEGIILEVAIQNHPSVIGLVGIDNFQMIGVEFSPEEMKEYMSFLDLMQNDYQNVVSNYAEQYLFHPSTDSAVRTRVKHDFVTSNEEIAVASLRKYVDYSQIEVKKLQQLPYKLYLLNSDAQPTNEEGLELYCNKSFEVFEIHATGHYPMIEKPEEFNEILSKILMMM